jgi:hypothetical protein
MAAKMITHVRLEEEEDMIKPSMSIASERLEGRVQQGDG